MIKGDTIAEQQLAEADIQLGSSS